MDYQTPLTAATPTGFATLTSKHPDSRRHPAGFLHVLFSALDNAQVRYCVLHSWDGLPEKLPSDLDIAVDPADEQKLPHVLSILFQQGYRPVQVLNYLVNAYYFVFFWCERSQVMAAALDVIFEHRRSGMIMASGKTLVSKRQKCGMFWTSGPSTEFSYLLAKKACKGSVSTIQADRLKFLVHQLGRSEAERLVSNIFRKKWTVRVVEACYDGSIGELVQRVKTQAWITSLTGNPIKLASYFYTDALRRLRRWFQPTGLFIGIMGPDGVGKSTLVNALLPELRAAFRRERVFHWRPGVMWQKSPSTPVSEPHQQPSRGYLLSIAHLFAFWLDFLVGYALLVRPLIARSGLVIFDRYFNDVLVDPKRYRYGGPMWLVRILRPLTPKPHVILILDAPPEVVFSRKREITLEDLSTQRQLYLRCMDAADRTAVVDATGPLSEVAARSAGIILEFLARRFKRRHSYWLSPSPDYK